MNKRDHYEKDIFIPQRFEKIIKLHIIKNMMKNAHDFSLILGIHGPSGVGKTFQCERVLQNMRIKSFLISGGLLESEKAGEPAKFIRETYIKASKSIDKSNAKKNDYNYAVILINDIDTGLGNWGELVQYTTNPQLVYGELMHLVDYPSIVDGLVTNRVPIIVTGNDFTKLYSPLLRAGRMTAFEWIPTIDEKTKIVKKIFSELDESDCKVLINYCERKESLPISFYSNLRSVIIEEIIWDLIGKINTHQIFEYFRNRIQPSPYEHINLKRLKVTADKIINSGQLINHLNS